MNDRWQGRLNKAAYYLSNYLGLLRAPALRSAAAMQRDRAACSNLGLDDRLAYYLGDPARWPCDDRPNWPTVADLSREKRNVYFFDLHRYARHYPREARLRYRFGDVIDCQPEPTLVKSRPIGQCASSVLFRLNAVRHFRFVHDTVPWAQKRDRLVWRGGAYQENRQRLLRQYFRHPLCDIGHVAKERSSEGFDKPFLSISEQLANKFVLSIEGNDVATNTKWIMASQSLCVMPPPRFETWFMEGRLEAGVHYAPIRADFSDLADTLDYYLHHPAEAEAIVKNANAWARQFGDPAVEALLCFRVLDEYFLRTTATPNGCPQAESVAP